MVTFNTPEAEVVYPELAGIYFGRKEPTIDEMSALYDRLPDSVKKPLRAEYPRLFNKARCMKKNDWHGAVEAIHYAYGLVVESAELDDAG